MRKDSFKKTRKADKYQPIISMWNVGEQEFECVQYRVQVLINKWRQDCVKFYSGYTSVESELFVQQFLTCGLWPTFLKICKWI